MFRVLPAALLAGCSFTSGAYPDDARTTTDDVLDLDGPAGDAPPDMVTSTLRAKTISVTPTTFYSVGSELTP